MNMRLTGARHLLGLGLALCACMASATETPTTPNQHRALDALVKDVCGKQLVLLGEDANHGSGATLALKIELVKRLVEECHYSAVLFESQVYDFIDLQHAIDAKTATPAQVNATIGGLWSFARETVPLVDFLYPQAMAGRITLGGLDPQVGGATQRYSQHRLPGVLAGYLNDARGKDCEAEFSRLTNWQYDDTIQFDATTRMRLRSCITDIQSGITQRKANDATREAGVMTTNLLRYLDMSDGDDFNVRDRAMFDNLVWNLSRLPKGAKTIVWCATVHAVKGSMPNSMNVSMGALVHAAFKDRAAAIGFTALSGSFGRPGKPPTMLEAASPESLEGRVFTETGDAIRYLDRKQLAGFGTVAARPLNYRKPEPAAWATLLDGLIVLREEQPQH
ncbi:erythromycin esterase family protein [Thermomonas sp.]|uniref:erythromycin esterase family protein n=1 Tax=Thermomonas sp. TaxID=1971895 RepID=UPI0024897B16|nr:erythromycin esterase family protein [Thermomonas sp.]MDI1254082.1 erythromycin esterase family protein [Thermomonas sp.]